MQKCSSRNYAFIDGQNLREGLMQSGLLMDYKLFRKYLSMKHCVVKAFLYIGYIKKNEALYKFLRSAGFNLVFKEVIEGGGRVKGNVDALMVADAMDKLCKNEFDKAVVVTSDGDFAPLIEQLQEKGKFKLLISPKKETCSILLKKRVAGQVRYISDFIHKVKRRSADT